MAFVVSNRIELNVVNDTIVLTETYSGSGNTIVLKESDLLPLICTIEKVRSYISK
jgi:hypothetical protein